MSEVENPVSVFDQRAADALKAMDAPAEAQESDAVPVKTEGESQASEPVAENKAAAEPQGQDEAQTWAKRALERITEREQAVAKREKEAPDIVREARADIKKFLKDRLGIEPGKLARALMAEDLGEAAPDAYRQIKEQVFDRSSQLNEFDSMRAEIEELKSQLSTRDVEMKRQVVVQQTQAEIGQYVTGELKEVPTVARAIKKNPQAVKDQVFQEMVKMANEHLEKGVQDMPSVAEAVKRVEKRMSEMAALFADPTKNDSESAPVKAKLTAGQSQQAGLKPTPSSFDERAAAAYAELGIK